MINFYRIGKNYNNRTEIEFKIPKTTKTKVSSLMIDQ